ncbi:MAG: class I SAM-dependent methyltransferase [Promethearchaeota archaeon]
MKQRINDYHGTEKSVEWDFMQEMLEKYGTRARVLDVGGIPSHPEYHSILATLISELGFKYEIADQRGACNFCGDFVRYPFKENDRWDIIMFISSIEHFPRNFDGDKRFREGYDRLAFKKAMEILKPNGYIFITVPFGKCYWQDWHQNYDWRHIEWLSYGSELIESYTYSLEGEEWIETSPELMKDIEYTDKCYGVGCFVFQKEEK